MKFEPRLAGKTVLVFDEEIASRNALADALEQLGATVYRAETLTEALCWLDAHVPAAAFVDLVPWTGGGHVLLTRLSQAGGNARPYIIATSSYDEISPLYVRRAGADRLIRKPFNTQELRFDHYPW